MPAFRVTATREISTLNDANAMMSVYRVSLVTESGATGTVDVPKAQWKPETVARILAEKAEELDLAFALAAGLG